jgi:4-azaleucine resistance transporter AzlC
MIRALDKSALSTNPALAAIREGWPVLLTPPIIGLTFGFLARQAGLDLAQTIAMSLLVFAGAAQFAAVDLLRGGAGPVVVVLTVLLINLRHALMATALRPQFVRAPVLTRLGLAYLLTDEAFAMGAGWYRRGGRGLAYYVTFGAALWASWQLSTVVGGAAGASLPDPHRLGLDFAITATFLAIVVLGVRDRTDIVVALVAGTLAGALRASGLAVVAVVVAGGLAPLLALRER